jgi:hypothetical protein
VGCTGAPCAQHDSSQGYKLRDETRASFYGMSAYVCNRTCGGLCFIGKIQSSWPLCFSLVDETRWKGNPHHTGNVQLPHIHWLVCSICM